MPLTEEELRDLIEQKSIIDKISSISFDGKTYITRIPREIVEMFKIDRGDKFRWVVDDEIKLDIIKDNDNTEKI